jgi:hypothetical protein
VTVAEGFFNVRLGQVSALGDNVFNNAQIWLGIKVGNNSEMTPRSRIVSVGYSYRVGTVDGAAGGTISGDVNIVGKANIGLGNVNTGTYAFVVGQDGTASGDFATVAGGRYNRAQGAYSVISGGGGPNEADSNAAIGDHSTIGGGFSNTANIYATIGGGYSNTAGGAATIGGGQWNTAEDLATIGGGSTNTAGYGGTISGGNGNTAGGGATVGGGGANTASGSSATISGGVENIASGGNATVGGGHYNLARGAYSVISGGGGPNASDSNAAIGDHSTIGGGFSNTANIYATIGGGYSNTAHPGATIAGGEWNTADELGTIGGGSHNTAGNTGTIGGGNYNTAGSGATVGGGGANTASGSSATISGGGENIASGSSATISGGESNTASGTYSIVPGGIDNRAGAWYSFAAGRRARVNASHTGAFVWSSTSSGSDSTASFAAFSFTARCAGGARFYTTQTGTATGVELSAGGGSWNNLCDVRQKRLHGDVNTADVLSKIAQLPLHRWSYKTQDESIQHIGPTAQDFYAAFHLGESDTTINTLDPDGIALAAIQELQKQNAELKSENEAIRAELSELKNLVKDLLTSHDRYEVRHATFTDTKRIENY